MVAHPRFRAAYDFLVLRSRVGDEDPALAEFWTALQAAAPAPRQQQAAAGPAPAPASVEAPARRRRRRPRRRKAGSTGS